VHLRRLILAFGFHLNLLQLLVVSLTVRCAFRLDELLHAAFATLCALRSRPPPR
jgi:hypothetical protein